jgi:tRNA(fMet)-specific endonuclease VapC
MSLYLLDTDIVSLFQHGHPAVYAAVARHAAADVGITVLTVEEQLSGWYTELRRAKTSQILAAVYQRMTDTVRFYAHMNIASYTEPRQPLPVSGVSIAIRSNTFNAGWVRPGGRCERSDHVLL